MEACFCYGMKNVIVTFYLNIWTFHSEQKELELTENVSKSSI